MAEKERTTIRRTVVFQLELTGGAMRVDSYRLKILRPNDDLAELRQSGGPLHVGVGDKLSPVEVLAGNEIAREFLDMDRALNPDPHPPYGTTFGPDPYDPGFPDNPSDGDVIEEESGARWILDDGRWKPLNPEKEEPKGGIN